MKKIFNSFVLVILASLLFYCSQVSPDITQIKNEIQTVLDEQKKSWNTGNIEGFMEYYWKSEDFTFQSGDKRLKEWETLLARYKENYSGEKMGKLDFTDIDIRVQSRDFAYVLGRWKLVFNYSSKEGLFTIIFKRPPEGWRIIHDHTS